MAGDQKDNHLKGGDGTIVDISPKTKAENVDWAMLKHEWVTTGISLTELADKYELPYYAVRNHYNRDKWKDALHSYNGMVKEAYEKVLAEKAQNLASRVAILDETVVAVSERMMNLIESQIIDLEYKAEADPEVIKTIVTTIKSASEALKNCHYNVRLANDQATSILEGRGFESRVSEEERIRLEKEFMFLKRNEDTIRSEISAQLREQYESGQAESIFDGESSQAVVGLKPSSNS